MNIKPNIIKGKLFNRIAFNLESYIEEYTEWVIDSSKKSYTAVVTDVYDEYTALIKPEDNKYKKYYPVEEEEFSFEKFVEYYTGIPFEDYYPTNGLSEIEDIVNDPTVAFVIEDKN